MSAGLTDLVAVPGGSLLSGSDDHYPEEAPARQVEVLPFQLERHPVTTAQYARFVEQTGYRTVAERSPDPAEFPGVPSDLLAPGALVFTPTTGPVDLEDWRQWWRFVPGACWSRPEGPGSSVADRTDHPVVQIAYADALAYARWAGRRLPTENELEHAMRAGRAPTTYAWGEEAHPEGRLMANTWQGQFPHRNTGALGHRGTSPVGAFPADPWGFQDLIGNVWEWTSTYYAVGPLRRDADRSGSVTCCTPDHAALRRLATAPGQAHPRRVVKGGSHLCAPEYCHRYRPSARQPQSEDTATSHLGFRCAL